MTFDDLFFRFHAIQRMLEKDILDVDVRKVLQNGDIIERSVDQFGMTKFIYLGFTHRRPIHVVVIDDHEACRTEIVTVYEPDLDEWNPGYRTRRKP